MELTTIDFIIIGLILFLSIKGIVTGFTRELLNFIGVVGGVALASRVGQKVGNFINEEIYPIANEPTLKLTGFIITLIGVWILFSFISSIVNKVFLNNISLFNRLLGYAITVLRYVAIFSLICVGIEKSNFLSEKFSTHFNDSKIFPLFIEVGENLLNRDRTVRNSESNSTIKMKDINLSTINLNNN